MIKRLANPLTLTLSLVLACGASLALVGCKGYGGKLSTPQEEGLKTTKPAEPGNDLPENDQ